MDLISEALPQSSKNRDVLYFEPKAFSYFNVITENPSSLLESDTVLYVLDTYRAEILHISEKGDITGGTGNGRGRGPGEFSFPFDFTVTEKGYFAVTDIDDKSLTLLYPDGKTIWKRYYKGPTPGRIAAKGSNLLAGIAGIGIEHLFEEINDENRILISYESFLTQPDDPELPAFARVSGMAQAGEFSATENHVIYLPHYIPVLVFYNFDGRVAFIRKTMDIPDKIPVTHFSKEPYLFTDGSGSLRPEFEGEYFQNGLSVARGYVHTWSHRASDETGTFILDRFDPYTGDYVNSLSFNFSEEISGIHVSETGIYLRNSASGMLRKISYPE